MGGVAGFVTASMKCAASLGASSAATASSDYGAITPDGAALLTFVDVSPT
jgi:hypothetical protein